MNAEEIRLKQCAACGAPIAVRSYDAVVCRDCRDQVMRELDELLWEKSCRDCRDQVMRELDELLWEKSPKDDTAK